MSITITPENFKKYAKRQQNSISKFFEEHNRIPSLNESQEILAKTFGFSNYYECIQKITESQIKPIKALINDLSAIVNHPNSSIKKCYIRDSYDDHQNNSISLNMTVDGDDYFLLSIPNQNINNTNFLNRELGRLGIKSSEIESFLAVFEKHLFKLEHQGLFFAVEAINELNLIDKSYFVIKNLPCKTYNEFEFNNKIYARQYCAISDLEFKRTLNNAEKEESINMVSIPYSYLSSLSGGTELGESFILNKIINTTKVFLETYLNNEENFKDDGHNIRLVKNAWFYDGRKLVKYEGLDIFKVL